MVDTTKTASEVVAENTIKTDAKPEQVVEVIKTHGLPVRCGGDRVYLLENGKRHWVSNAEAYSKLGFKFGDEREIDRVSLDLFPEGDALR